MSIISLQNVSLSFGENQIFSNISFNIEDKEKMGLIGRNGAGKTSLFKIIMGVYSQDNGNVIISKDTKIGYMEQHACSDVTTVWNELVSVFDKLIDIENKIKDINFQLANDPENRDELIENLDYLNEQFTRDGGLTYKSRTKSALIGLGFDESDFDKPTSKLSGGQRSKIILAKLLLSDSNFLLLDEPTNHLDIEAISWLESYLKSYTGSFIVISHDRYFLDKVTSKTGEISSRKFRIYSGNYSEYVIKRDNDRKAIQDKYDKDIKEIERLEAVVTQQRQWNREKSIKKAESTEKRIEKIKEQLVLPDLAESKLHFDFTPKIESGNDVLFVNNLSKSFGEKKIFDDVSFDVFKGERVFILGPNGCGKSTLLKTLIKQYDPSSGSFNFGVNVLCGYFDQVQENLNLEINVLENIWETFPNKSETSIRSALAAFNFKGEEVFKELKDCSGGERARVSILKLMLGGYNFLLLDEPTNHLDAYSRELLEDTLKDFNGTILAVSHDRYLINKLATKIVYFKDGTVHNLNGNYDKYVEIVDQVQETPKKQNDDNSANKAEYIDRKQKQAAIRKLKADLRKIESEIDEIEIIIENDQSLLNETSDYEELNLITNRLNENINTRDKMYETWELISLELTAFES